MSNAHPRPWHRGSIFGDGPRRALDRDQRARFRFLLAAHYRANVLRALGRDEEARSAYRRALALGADPVEIRFALDHPAMGRIPLRLLGVGLYRSSHMLFVISGDGDAAGERLRGLHISLTPSASRRHTMQAHGFHSRPGGPT